MRSRLPEELWAAAAKLARRDGIEATARALDVDRPSLAEVDGATRATSGGQQLAGRQPKRRVNAMPAFVELLAAGSSGATSCLVEVESPRGGKLRLELKAIATSQLAELIRAFATT